MILGDKRDISAEQWSLLRLTGTSHLMAISGLHIAMLAWFVYRCVFVLFGWLGLAGRPWPLQRYAAIGALMSAVLYALLAGFTVPTQRAVIMLAVFMMGDLFGRQYSLWQRFCLSMLLVLFYDPLSVLSTSFLFSFSAVFIILIIGLIGKGEHSRFKTILQPLKLQLSLSLLLIPLTTFCFTGFSLISFFANAIAIPLFGIVILPLTFLGVICSNAALGEMMLRISTEVFSWLLSYFSLLANAQGSLFLLPISKLSVMLLAFVFLFLLILPTSFIFRFIIVSILSLVFVQKPFSAKSGEVVVDVLDVGQGLSVLIHTHQHHLLYDTGPRFGVVNNAGKRLLIPYLQRQRIHTLDTIIVSHRDADHSGGLLSMHRAYPTANVISNVQYDPPGLNVSPCVAGYHWVLDGISFEFLHPQVDELIKEPNNRSCMLKITVGSHSLLLTGDIESSIETRLVDSLKNKLHADVLVAPHHGSKTSSSAPFIDAVSPTMVVYSARRPNRYGFPHPEVVQRYAARGIKQLSTGQDGSIRFRLSKTKVESLLLFTSRHFWD